MEKPDEHVPDSAWPLTYRINARDWKNLKNAAKPTGIGDKHQVSISAIIAAYRYKSLAYPEGHDPRQLKRSLESLLSHLEIAIEKLSERDVAQTLAVVERSYADLYSLPVDRQSTPRGELRLPALVRATTILRQLTEHAVRLRMFDKRRAFGSTTEFEEEVRIPTSHDPPLDELVRDLFRCWCDEIGGPQRNYVDETQDPPRGASLTKFVHGCLAIAQARDRNGKPFSLVNVRQLLRRSLKKPGVGRSNSLARTVRAPRQGTKSAEKRKPRS